MEILFELLYEILIEGLVGAARSKKIPRIIRLLIATVLCGAIITILIWVGVSALNNTGIIAAVICRVIACGFIILWLFRCMKIIKVKNK